MYHVRRKIQQAYCFADNPGKINYNHPSVYQKRKEKYGKNSLGINYLDGSKPLMWFLCVKNLNITNELILDLYILKVS